MGKQWRINDQYWRVYRGILRPAPFDTPIIEIQTKSGRCIVIPWTGFDAMPCSKTEKLAIARHIVRLHNEELNRQNNAR